VLAGTLTGTSGQNGVTIASDNVTLDLNGHALVGVPGSQNGIFVSGVRRHIVVKNGTLHGWGGHGVRAFQTAANQAVHSEFAQLNVRDNGGHGIEGGYDTVFKDCVVRQNGDAGVRALDRNTFIQITATSNTSHGIFAGSRNTVLDCVAIGNGDHGIRTTFGSRMDACSAQENAGDGIHAAGAVVTIHRAITRGNSGHGIHILGSSTVTDNLSVGNSSNGIHVAFGSNRIEGNQVAENSVAGIRVAGAGNLIIRNSASDHPFDNHYDIVAGNEFGPIGNMGSAGTSPWANFEF